jgi:HAE1 family hydrophobic/amphiphilic exporter-1
MLVLFIFFGDFKASLIVGSSMPIALAATLIFMSFAGFSLNVVTMGALVIAIGMMVDSSIVVLESCFRLRDKNLDFKEAALEGTKTVASSVSASTLTTVVVYVPLATMNGLAGQIFKELGFTIIFAMLSSLVVSITLIPIFFWKYRPVEKKKTLLSINFWSGFQRGTDGY